MNIPQFNPVPPTFEDEKTHRLLLAQASNRHNQGKFNCAVDFTLTANASSTTLNDNRITPFSVLVFMPTTANAAAELATLYVPEATMAPVTGAAAGSAVVQHANNAQTDRSFRVGIFG